MNAVELKRDDYLFPLFGASIMFHIVRWGDEMDSFTLKTGGNILYHTLSGETVPHTHQFAEILIVLKGKLVHCVNGEDICLDGGSIVFLRPSDTHCFRRHENESCELVTFSFMLEYLLDVSRYLEEDSFMRKFTDPVLPPSFGMNIDEAENLAVRLLKINSIQITSGKDARARIKNIIIELFCKYFLENENVSQYDARHDRQIPDWMQTLCEEMKKDENIKAGLSRMQSLAGKTPEHLCFCFKKYMDKTPTGFLNEQKLAMAAKLLISTDNKLLSIANESGFISLSHFHHLFLKKYHISPKKYREHYKKNDIP